MTVYTKILTPSPSAVEQVTPSSPEESIPAQAAVEAVSPSSGYWTSYHYGGIYSSAADACAVYNGDGYGGTSTYYGYPFKFVYAGTTENLGIGFPYLDCLSTVPAISLPPNIPPPPTTPLRNGTVKLIFVCPAPVINPVVPYTYNRSTGLCERAAAPCPVATPAYTLNAATNRCERPAVCPNPVTYPEISYTYNPASLMCERMLPEIYILTLTHESATIEPGKTYTFTATVTKQGGGAPSQPIPIAVKVDVDPKSGGHDHGEALATRPKGSVSPASGSTVLVFTFTATDVSGTHTITARCDLCVNKTEQAKVTVMVEGLKPISGSPFYALRDANGDVIGAVIGKHEANHYLTPEAAGKLVELAKIYRGISKGERLLYLNDASLIWGGLFDVGSRPWKTPHEGHRRGVVIDIRASMTPGSIPFWLFGDFEIEAEKKGTKAALHCLDNGTLLIGHICYEVLNSRHFHVQLLGVDK